MEISQKTLSNELTSIVVPMQDTLTATALVMVGAGTRFETEENNGVSHFLEHMCFKGTESRPNPRMVATALDSLGAESNAFTGYEYTGYYGKSRAGNTDEVLEILGDIYQNSLLPAEEIKKEAGVITEEIQMYEDLPMQKVHDLFRENIFGDQPAGWRVLGPKNVIQSLDKEELTSYRNDKYTPEDTTVIVVGGVEVEPTQDKIFDHFKKLEKGKQNEKTAVDYQPKDNPVSQEQKDSKQTHLVLGTPAVAKSSDKLPAIEVLSTILGRGLSSRLFYRLRDQMGVCYYVKSNTEYYSDSGIFKIATGVDTNRTEEVIEAICDELEIIINEKVKEEELEKAKEYLAGNFLFSHESTNELAFYLAEQSVLGIELEKPKEYIKRVKTVSADDVRKVAGELFKNSLRVSVIGPEIDKEKINSLITKV